MTNAELIEKLLRLPAHDEVYFTRWDEEKSYPALLAVNGVGMTAEWEVARGIFISDNPLTEKAGSNS
jgi:hypothetical protein